MPCFRLTTESWCYLSSEDSGAAHSNKTCMSGCCLKYTSTATTLSRCNISPFKISDKSSTPSALCLYPSCASLNLEEWLLKFVQDSSERLPHTLGSIWLETQSCFLYVFPVVCRVPCFVNFGVNAFFFFYGKTNNPKQAAQSCMMSDSDRGRLD